MKLLDVKTPWKRNLVQLSTSNERMGKGMDKTYLDEELRNHRPQKINSMRIFIVADYKMFVHMPNNHMKQVPNYLFSFFKQ